MNLNTMPTKVNRRTVDLSQYPGLVVVYLGMRVNRLTGLKTLFGFGPKISTSVAAQPDGLLLHENFLFSLFPPHGGMRQYWRDMESLLAWTRSEPHRDWWKSFLKDSKGTGFWHETYMLTGGMEAIYDDVPEPIRLPEICSRAARAWSHVRSRNSLAPGARRRARIVGDRVVRQVRRGCVGAPRSPIFSGNVGLLADVVRRPSFGLTWVVRPSFGLTWVLAKSV